MSGSAKIRHGSSVVDGLIQYDETPLAWIDADQRAGFRLDRRKAWAFVEGRLCEMISWTDACSGCRYGFKERGSGCNECGHHGVVREAMWVPYSTDQRRVA